MKEIHDNEMRQLVAENIRKEKIPGLYDIERLVNELKTLSGVTQLILDDTQDVDTDGAIAMYVVDREIGRIIDELESASLEMRKAGGAE